MSTSYHAQISIDGYQTYETVRGLDRARDLAADLAAARGLRIYATDWRRDADGVWRTRNALAPAISVRLVPGRAVTVPQQRQPSLEER